MIPKWMKGIPYMLLVTLILKYHSISLYDQFWVIELIETTAPKDPPNHSRCFKVKGLPYILLASQSAKKKNNSSFRS